MQIKEIPGGVCAPKDFVAAGLHCGIAKKADKKDLALLYSKRPATCAGVFTVNKVKASPVLLTMEHVKNGSARAVIANSGNANACNADGMEVAGEMCALAARELGIAADEVVVASTGVIGQPLPIAPIASHISALAGSLSEDGSRDAVHAIMTTDTAEKEIAVSFEADGVEYRVGGIAKGSGMIHPNMGTMLGFVTTDAAVPAPLLQKLTRAVTAKTFNMVSVDGDTSTNDTFVIMANGAAGGPEMAKGTPACKALTAALTYVATYLARLMAKDGEGATKLLECTVTGAPSNEAAVILSKSVITSSLFKAAMFGADANWGRVLCALGYAEADFDISKTCVAFASAKGGISVCEDGAGIPFSEEKAKEILLEDEIKIIINLHQGGGEATAWGCDLTYDYVKINGDYRS